MSSKRQKIAFQGAYGAYSDLSCRVVFPDIETVPCKSFHVAFKALQDGDVDMAMIPVDNTIAGRVADVHHLLPNSNLFIIGEHFQPIHHCLLGIKGTPVGDLKHVHSHVHALPQCRRKIAELHLNAHVHADTAGAAAEVAKMNNPEHAAIASALAAEIYGLDILAENIEDEGHNTTRFLILSREAVTPALNPNQQYITSLSFTVRNMPAALYKALGGFATNNISLAKLESYVDEKFQAAEFYCDIEAHQDSASFKLAIEELGFYAQSVTLLGTYAAHPFRRKTGE